jgi:P63C domain
MNDQNEDTLPVILTPSPSGRVRSGKARMEKMTPEERSELARQGASARWSRVGEIDQVIYRASHTGKLTLRLGEEDLVIQCAVLDDKVTRVISRNAVFRAFGRTKRGRAKSENRVPNMPTFMDAKNLQPFVIKNIDGGLNQIAYKDIEGRLNTGYNALLLPKLCNVYLDARRARATTVGQNKLAEAAEILLGALGTVGIVALVDEATGFQDVRDRQALEEILNQYIGSELAKWAKRFPDEFYKEVFRLQGWHYDPTNSRRPMQMAKLTIDLVYDRIGPGLTKELQGKRQEIYEATGRRGKLQQILTPEVGHPALQHHLSGLIFLAKSYADNDWMGFYSAVDRVAKRYNRTMLLPFADEPIGASASELTA